MRRILVGTISALLLAGCSVKPDLDVAGSAIGEFHGRLNRGEFRQIYAGSSEEMKSVTNEADFLRLLGGVRSGLGRFRAGKNVGWSDNRSSDGHFLSIDYAGTYEKGPARENFVFRLENGRAVLAGYHVGSDRLISR